MRRTLIIGYLLLACISLFSRNTVWHLVNERYNVGDYEQVKSILDTMYVSPADSADWMQWMGRYFYWLSYEEPSLRAVAEKYLMQAIAYTHAHHLLDQPLGFFYLHLGELYYLDGNYDLAISHLRCALTAKPYSQHARFPSPYNDPSPLYKGLGMCYAQRGEYDHALSLLDSCSLSEQGALSVVRMRGKVLALKGDDEAARVCYEQFIHCIRTQVRDSFLTLSPKDKESWWMSVRPFIADCWRLERAAPELLYDVALLTKGILLQDTHVLNYTHTDIHHALRPGEVAIEWMMYERGGQKQLGAVVMNDAGQISFVPSGSTKDISAHPSCVWSEAMLTAVGEADKIFFAPDGVLNQVGIEYAFPDTSKQLYRLSSTRELIHRRSIDYAHATAAVIGDMNYDSLSHDYQTMENDDRAYLHLKKQGNVHFRPLQHARQECDTILSIRHHIGDTLLIREEAKESHFRMLAGKYDLLHLSTHGYYHSTYVEEDSDFPRRDKVDYALSESGLLFNGVNCELNDRHYPLDGIISARELSQMDLTHVDLCVISACEGALGHIGADGTYGIQRGLKAAGAGAMMLSLWEVSDEATCQFMTLFYANLEACKNVYEAFHKARQQLREYEQPIRVYNPITLRWENSQRRIRVYNEPHYYNAFILIDVL